MQGSMDGNAGRDNTVSFAQALAGSPRFKGLFAEGMQLVEDAASYLDGPGRLDARGLGKTMAQAYSAESMRLTTRLMQIASWLLIRRAISAGEMTTEEAAAEKIRVRISVQSRAAAPAIFDQLPERLKTLTEQSLRLQARIVHLDRAIQEESADVNRVNPKQGVEQQFDRLRSVYGSVA